MQRKSVISKPETGAARLATPARADDDNSTPIFIDNDESTPSSSQKTDKPADDRLLTVQPGYIANAAENVYYVEKILNKKIFRGKIYYLIHWYGYTKAYDTWEPVENLNCQRLLKKYEKLQMNKGAYKKKKSKNTSSMKVNLMTEIDNTSALLKNTNISNSTSVEKNASNCIITSTGINVSNSIISLAGTSASNCNTPSMETSASNDNTGSMEMNASNDNTGSMEMNTSIDITPSMETSTSYYITQSAETNNSSLESSVSNDIIPLAGPSVLNDINPSERPHGSNYINPSERPHGSNYINPSVNTSKDVHEPDIKDEQINSPNIADYIVGIQNINGVVNYLVQWQGKHDADFFPAEETKNKWPELILQFLEERFLS